MYCLAPRFALDLLVPVLVLYSLVNVKNRMRWSFHPFLYAVRGVPSLSSSHSVSATILRECRHQVG